MSTRMQDHMFQALGELRHEPLEWRLRAQLGDEIVVDSRRAVLVWEPRRVVPSYAVPAEDIGAELTAAANGDGHRAVDGVLHPGIPFAVHTAVGDVVAIGGRAGAGFRLADADLAGYVMLGFDAFDAWYEEDERVEGHPREPYHRVDVRRSAQPIRIELDGEVVAATTNARLLCETSLPMRFYLPREDIRAVLHPGSKPTHCPYKGRATSWSLGAGGRRHDDLAWSYAEPLPGVADIAGLVAFWDERVDVFVDGERRERPGGDISAALRDEFGV